MITATKHATNYFYECSIAGDGGGGCVAVAVVVVVVVVLAMGSHGPAGRLASTLVSQAVGSQFDAT